MIVGNLSSGENQGLNQNVLKTSKLLNRATSASIRQVVGVNSQSRAPNN